jgi:hypothetical protein
MVAQRAEYVATGVIEVNGVRGYNPGDPVPAGVVESLGLVVGEQVEPTELKLLPRPAKGARRPEWAAYARSQGVPQDEVDTMTVKDLETRFEEPQPESDDDGET